MIRDDQIGMFGGALALMLVLGALAFQYIVHLAPCEMCHWQRWPHIAAALIALGFVLKRNNAVISIVVIMAVTILGIMVAGQSRIALPLGAAAIAMSAISLWLKKNPVALILMLLALSGLVGAYQWGMQLGFLPGPSACTGARFVIGSNVVPEVSCNAVTWSLFGLSLAAYNALFSLGGALAGFVLLNRKPS